MSLSADEAARVAALYVSEFGPGDEDFLDAGAVADMVPVMTRLVGRADMDQVAQGAEYVAAASAEPDGWTPSDLDRLRWCLSQASVRDDQVTDAAAPAAQAAQSHSDYAWEPVVREDDDADVWC